MLEVGFAWFWVIKVITIIAAFWIGSNVVRCAFRSTFWNTIGVIFTIIAVFTPIKVDNIQTNGFKTTQELRIEAKGK